MSELLKSKNKNNSSFTSNLIYNFFAALCRLPCALRLCLYERRFVDELFLTDFFFFFPELLFLGRPRLPRFCCLVHARLFLPLDVRLTLGSPPLLQRTKRHRAVAELSVHRAELFFWAGIVSFLLHGEIKKILIGNLDIDTEDIRLI